MVSTAGIGASLLAPLVMTIGFMVWESHWKGSAFALNLYKCNLASIGFLVIVLATNSKSELSRHVEDSTAIMYLILSSFIGIVIGDLTWLQALQTIGARKVILMDSLKPFLAALMGWLILEEDLKLKSMSGIILTVVGVLVVSLDSKPTELSDTVPREKADGYEGGSTEPLTVEDNEAASPLEEELDLTGKARDSKSPSTKNCAVLGQREEEESAEDHMESIEAPNEKRSNDSYEKEREQQVTPEVSRFQSFLGSQCCGYIMSILNVVLDTYGAILIKQHGGELTVWEINLLRFGFSGLFMLLVAVIARVLHQFCMKKPRFSQKSRTMDEKPCARTDKTSSLWYVIPLKEMPASSWFKASTGVLLVTFFAPALSNYALFRIVVALALTLSSLGPIYSLVLEFLFKKVKPTIRSVLGSALALCGIVVLSLLG